MSHDQRSLVLVAGDRRRLGGAADWRASPAGGSGAERTASGGSPKDRSGDVRTIRHTILYVEDNPASQKLMEEIVGRVPNLARISARDAESGLELAKEHRPDVIVMDINLPGADGFEALKRLREIEHTRHILVIALTANAMPIDMEMGAKAGFHRYLTKPVNIDEVLAAIEDALEGVS